MKIENLLTLAFTQPILIGGAFVGVAVLITAACGIAAIGSLFRRDD